MIGESISEFEVFKRRSANHCCLLESTRRWVTLLYGDKEYLSHKGSNVAKKIDARIQKELRDSQYHGCITYKREQRVQHLHETERKQD